MCVIKYITACTKRNEAFHKATKKTLDTRSVIMCIKVRKIALHICKLLKRPSYKASQTNTIHVLDWIILGQALSLNLSRGRDKMGWFSLQKYTNGAYSLMQKKKPYCNYYLNYVEPH